MGLKRLFSGMMIACWFGLDVISFASTGDLRTDSGCFLDCVGPSELEGKECAICLEESENLSVLIGLFRLSDKGAREIVGEIQCLPCLEDYSKAKGCVGFVGCGRCRDPEGSSRYKNLLLIKVAFKDLTKIVAHYNLDVSTSMKKIVEEEIRKFALYIEEGVGEGSDLGLSAAVLRISYKSIDGEQVVNKDLNIVDLPERDLKDIQPIYGLSKLAIDFQEKIKVVITFLKKDDVGEESIDRISGDFSRECSILEVFDALKNKRSDFQNITYIDSNITLDKFQNEKGFAATEISFFNIDGVVHLTCINKQTSTVIPTLFLGLIGVVWFGMLSHIS